MKKIKAGFYYLTGVAAYATMGMMVYTLTCVVYIKNKLEKK